MSNIYYDKDSFGDPMIVVESRTDHEISISITNGLGFSSIESADTRAGVLLRIGDPKFGSAIDMSFNEFTEIFKFVLEMYEKTPGGKVDE